MTCRAHSDLTFGPVEQVYRHWEGYDITEIEQDATAWESPTPVLCAWWAPAAMSGSSCAGISHLTSIHVRAVKGRSDPHDVRLHYRYERGSGHRRRVSTGFHHVESFERLPLIVVLGVPAFAAKDRPQLTLPPCDWHPRSVLARHWRVLSAHVHRCGLPALMDTTEFALENTMEADARNRARRGEATT